VVGPLTLAELDLPGVAGEHGRDDVTDDIDGTDEVSLGEFGADFGYRQHTRERTPALENDDRFPRTSDLIHDREATRLEDRCGQGFH
jgi:hypothetical protein